MSLHPPTRAVRTNYFVMVMAAMAGLTGVAAIALEFPWWIIWAALVEVILTSIAISR